MYPRRRCPEAIRHACEKIGGTGAVQRNVRTEVRVCQSLVVVACTSIDQEEPQVAHTVAVPVFRREVALWGLEVSRDGNQAVVAVGLLDELIGVPLKNGM